MFNQEEMTVFQRQDSASLTPGIRKPDSFDSIAGPRMSKNQILAVFLTARVRFLHPVHKGWKDAVSRLC